MMVRVSGHRRPRLLPAPAMAVRPLPLLILCIPSMVAAWAAGLTETADLFTGQGGDGSVRLFRWSAGPSLIEDPISTAGLRGGITWALDPGLCNGDDNLIRLLPEQRQMDGGVIPAPALFSCAELRRSVQRAMSAWERSNNNIFFFDVTSICENFWQSSAEAVAYLPSTIEGPAGASTANVANSTNATADAGVSPSPAPPPAPPSGPPLTPFPASPPGFPPSPPPPEGILTDCVANTLPRASCPYAELLIGRYKPDDRDNRAHACVMLHTSLNATPVVSGADYPKGSWPTTYEVGEAAPDTDARNWQGGFAPSVPAAGGTIDKAELLFNVQESQCYWYDEWCESIYTVEQRAEQDGGLWKLLNGLIVNGCQIIYAIGIALALVQLLLEVYHVLQTVLLSWDTDGDGVVEIWEVAQALKIIAYKFADFLCCDRFKDKSLQGRTIEGKAFCYGMLDVFARLSVLLWVLILWMLFYPMRLHAAMFEPCWECNDLTALTTQQLGRVLGLYNAIDESEMSTSRRLEASRLLSEAGGSGILNSSSASSVETFFYESLPASDGVMRHNCSEPLAAVQRLPPGTRSSPTLMGSPVNAKEAREGDSAWERLATPTDADADAMRALYPECVQLRLCEYETGRQQLAAAGISTECVTYTGTYDLFGTYQWYENASSIPSPAAPPASPSPPSKPSPPSSPLPPHSPPSPMVPDPSLPPGSPPPSTPPPPTPPDTPPTPFSPPSPPPSQPSPPSSPPSLPATASGRPVRPVSGHLGEADFIYYGAFRAQYLLLKSMFWPLVVFFAIKFIAMGLRRLPVFKETRLNAERLQRIAAMRRQEVRRMTEGGQEYLIRKNAKRADVNMQEAVNKLAAICGQKRLSEASAGVRASIVSAADADGDGKLDANDFRMQMMSKLSKKNGAARFGALKKANGSGNGSPRPECKRSTSAAGDAPRDASPGTRRVIGAFARPGNSGGCGGNGGKSTELCAAGSGAPAPASSSAGTSAMAAFLNTATRSNKIAPLDRPPLAPQPSNMPDVPPPFSPNDKLLEASQKASGKACENANSTLNDGAAGEQAAAAAADAAAAAPVEALVASNSSESATLAALQRLSLPPRNTRVRASLGFTHRDIVGASAESAADRE